MATLTGFSRGTDPIRSDDLATKISTDIGKTVTVIVNPNSVDVTGATISGADTTAIQASINSYVYAALEYGVGLYADPDVQMTANSNTRVATQKAMKAMIVANRRTAWVSGAERPGSFVYCAKATTSSGSATFYLTDDGTSAGNAVFSTIYADSIAAIPYGANGNYQVSNPTVSGDRKSVTVNVSQITTVLGILTFNTTAGNGIDCRLYVMGS